MIRFPFGEAVVFDADDAARGPGVDQLLIDAFASPGAD